MKLRYTLPALADLAAILNEIDRHSPAGSETRQAMRRLTVDEMLAVGAEIAAMPLLDPRSPQEIMDDINAQWRSSIVS